MRQKIIILLCIVIGTATACHKEDLSDTKNMKKTTNDYVPVSFSLKVDKPMINETEYVTMKNSKKSSEYKTMISHEYRLLIAKEVNSLWVVDTIIIGSFLPTNPIAKQYIYLTENASLPTVDLELRPGNYKAVFFTGSKSLNWQTNIKTNMIIDTIQPPLYCYYQTTGGGYVNSGEKQLSEEIFTGIQQFTIDKNDTLSNYQRTIHKTIQLQRKVSKFRIYIKNEETSSGNEYFLSQGSPAIKAIMTTTPGTYFCSGLDVWGDPYFDTGNPLDRMVYCSYTLQNAISADNGSEYYIAIPRYASVYACYFLCDAQNSLQVTVSGIDVSVSLGLPNYQYNIPIENVALNWNSINGLIFKPTDHEDDSGPDIVFILDMEMESNVPANTLDVFGPYYEINY